MKCSVLALSTVALVATARLASPHHRRQLPGNLLGSASAAPVASTGASASPASTAAPATSPAAATPSTAAQVASTQATPSAASIETPASTAALLPPVVASFVSSVASRVSSAVAPLVVPSSSAAAAPTSSVGSQRIVTSTSTFNPSATSSSPTLGALPSLTTASPSSTSANLSSTSSGISHGTLIAIIIAASCVAGIAAIWTIIRKVKFSPSKRFESKLSPVDFVPNAGAGGFGKSHSEESLRGQVGGYAPSLEGDEGEKRMGELSYGSNGNYSGAQQYAPDNGRAPPMQYGNPELQRGQSVQAPAHRAYPMNDNYYGNQPSRY